MVRHAAEQGYSVVQVNTNGGTYDLTRAIVETAEEKNSPVILGAYEANLAYRGFGFAALVMRWFAERASVPVAIHLDHGSTVDACRDAIEAGFTSVMIDGSHLPLEENIQQCLAAVALARAHDITVEAEVGELQNLNPDGSITNVKNLSDPDEVRRISRETGIDMLAVGIGNAHGFYKGQPNIRLDLLDLLADASAVPLVLHGSTGLSPDTIRGCISRGMAKLNLGTVIRTRYVEDTAEVIAEGDHQFHPWRVCREVKERIKRHIREIIDIAGSTNRADGGG
jgi:ketose-bisphosphate aldolase